jgi:hypothetical protein
MGKLNVKALTICEMVWWIGSLPTGLSLLMGSVVIGLSGSITAPWYREVSPDLLVGLAVML